MNPFFLLLADAPPAEAEAVKTLWQKITTQFSSFDRFMETFIKMALMSAFCFIIIFIYRHFWYRWWKKNPPKIKDRFIYNITMIVAYIVSAILVITRIPDSKDIVVSIIAGSGFLALGLGLAAQEALGNVINGMMLSVSKPFEVGDRIRLVNGNITGTVEDITLRHTVIKTFINSRIIVPNSTINKDLIENSNYQQGRASSFLDVTITYDSDVDKAKEIMEQAVGEHPNYFDIRHDLNEPKVKVYVRDLSINGVCLRASMWTASIDNNFEACSDVRYIMHKRFKEAGILLAQLPGRPEAFARAGVPDRA